MENEILKQLIEINFHLTTIEVFIFILALLVVLKDMFK